MRLGLHPQQNRALFSEATEILYGGAAGGGKSHLMRVAAIAWCIAVPGLQVYLFRREYPDLRANHFEGRSSFPAILGEWIASGHVRYNSSELSIAFSNGSKIFGRHCQHESDVYGYQGFEFDVLMFDEITHFSEAQYRFLRSRCRTAGLELPAGARWTFPRILASGNPGGPGHNWVKAAWIDPIKEGGIRRADKEDGGMLRQFVAARLEDNPSVDGEEYRAKLSGLGDPALVKAMLDGDWDIVAGGMFDDVWSGVVREPFAIPDSWRKSRSFDWGSSHPFAVLWFAESDGTGDPRTNTPALPKGTLVMTHEWYGWNGKPNEGCRMLAADIARGIIQREKEWGLDGKVVAGPADSAIFTNQDGHCIADNMASAGVRWLPADKGPGSRINGWERLRQLMRASSDKPMERPGLLIFSGCRQSIRTLPTLPRDPSKSDDVDSDSEDHIADALRYRATMPDRIAGGVRLP